ncbi:MAG: glycosyltransferase family 39 protein, partial [Chloroflexaceae bacterium]|nr:glycosyltransferase family 39 protein [Chloroflexaceae bacterium]
CRWSSAGAALQIGMITLTIPLAYAIGSRLFNRRAGLIYAGILAVWFPFVELPIHLFSEPTFFFCLVVHLWLLLRWRDNRRWTTLALAGIAIGYASLARSTTLYGVVFAVLFIVLESHRTTAAPADAPGLGVWPWLRQQWQVWLARLRLREWWLAVLRNVAIFLLACAAIITPWTLRNYLVYDRFIPIDTLSSVNLWLHVEKYPEKGVEIIKTYPQADRHIFAREDTRRIMQADPVAFWNLIWRNAGFHFQHIWKAQFTEDFLTRPSFYGRPLREFWVLGVASDVLWFVFTLGGLLALTTPTREGAFRVVALAWISFTIVAMMIMHIEPRYLFPIWTFLALYGAWALSRPRHFVDMLRQHRLHGAMALVIGAVFLSVFFTYRNYPQLIVDGIARETNYAAGMQAYQAGDYAAAEDAFRAALDVHGTFTELRANLALALIAQGQTDAAREVLGTSDAQHIVMVRGVLARTEGNLDEAATYLIDSEKRAGMNMQAFGLQIDVKSATAVQLGTGLDLGYIAGFSSVEQLPQPDGTIQTYRWLQGTGRLHLPLSEPLQAGSVLELRLTSGQPGAVPLTLTFANGEHKTIQIESGQWRIYRVAVPAALAGRTVLDVALEAPIFIPASTLPGSIDTRPLSLMVSTVQVEGVGR